MNALRDLGPTAQSVLNFSLNIEHSTASKLSVKAAYSGHRGSVSFVLSIVREWPESFLPSDVGANVSLPRLPKFGFFGYEPERHARHCAPRRRRSRRG